MFEFIFSETKREKEMKWKKKIEGNPIDGCVFVCILRVFKPLIILKRSLTTFNRFFFFRSEE